MRLTLKPVELPFMVGDIVIVNQPYENKADERSYFQAQIMQIILDGSIRSSSVIRVRQEAHQLVISSVMYDVKPLGEHQGLPRKLVEVQLLPLEQILFSSQEALSEWEESID